MTELIKNGTVITSTGVDPAEVLIDGETIVAAPPRLSTPRAST